MIEPRFEEIVGDDVAGEERERLRRAHEALLIAGPPPALTPALAKAPSPLRTVRRRSRRPLAVALPLAAALALAAFAAGWATRGQGEDFVAERSLALRATSLDPDATGTLRIGARDGAGNYPMVLEVENLDPLAAPDGYYEVVLARNGERIGPCGSFDAVQAKTRVLLNAPYEIRPGDGWIVVVHREEHVDNPPVVMTTI